jgi:hypothetical protein
VRSDDLVFLAEKGSIRTYMLAGASRLRAYEGKRVRISSALDSPQVIVVRTIDEFDETAPPLRLPQIKVRGPLSFVPAPTIGRLWNLFPWRCADGR